MLEIFIIGFLIGFIARPHVEYLIRKKIEPKRINNSNTD